MSLEAYNDANAALSNAGGLFGMLLVDVKHALGIMKTLFVDP